MPLTKSAKKALRRDRRRAIVNLRLKRKAKAALKLARQKPTSKNLSAAYSVLDRAAKKDVIHKSKASRLKSRLAKLAKKSKKPKDAKEAKGKTTKTPQKKTAKKK